MDGKNPDQDVHYLLQKLKLNPKIKEILKGGKATAIEWPKMVTHSVLYAFTAHNPMGAEMPDAWNREANARLEEEIGTY